MNQLRLLGTLALSSDNAKATDVLVHAKRVALLSYLALSQPRGFHRRDRLYALLWPEADTERARNSLRQAVHQLRQALGPQAIVNRGDEEIGLASDVVACDALDLERAVAEGRHADAVGLYGGELLSGFHVPGARDFSDWLDGERERLRDLATQAAWTLVEDLARRGQPAEAARIARTAAGWRPFSETANRRLIELLDRLGDTAGALRAYDAFAERLRVEMDAAPSAATTALVGAIRARAPVLPPPPAWGLPDPIAPPAESRVPRRRPGVLYAAGLLTVLAIAGMWQGGKRLVAARPDQTRVAVFPFTVRGGPDLRYLGEGMVDLLSAKLDGAVGLRATNPRSAVAAIRALGDTGSPAMEALVRVARQLGAGRFVVGELVEVGLRVQVSATLHDLGGREVSRASVTGDASAVFALVDGLTGRLLAGTATGRDTALTRLAALTTQSLPALKAFLEGEQALRQGLDARAASAFREAVLLDTTFALAEYRLALSSTWVAVPQAPIPEAVAQAAARHATRLTPLVRDLVSAYDAYKSMRADEAEQRYRTITASHPDHLEAWFMLGETWFHYNPYRGRSPAEAWPAFQRALSLDRANAHTLLHLARLAANEGRRALLDSLVGAYLARYPDAERTLEMRGLAAYVGDDAALQAAVTREALEADDLVAVSVLQAAALFSHNLAAAARFAPRYARTAGQDRATVAALRIITDLSVAGGKLSGDPGVRLLAERLDEAWLLESRALIAAEPALPLSRGVVLALRDTIASWRPYPVIGVPGFESLPAYGRLTQSYLLGLLDARLGDTASAARHARALAAERDTLTARPAAHLAQAIRAELARSRGNLRGALDELDRIPYDFGVSWFQRPSHWGVRERFLRAELLRALGRFDDARQVYESLRGTFDLPFLALSHLRMGEVHERLGNAERADFHYGRFLRLWHDCDPELRPLVAGAGAARTRALASR